MDDRLMAATLLMCLLVGLSFELSPRTPTSRWESLIAFGLALIVAALGWGAWWLIRG